MPLGAARTTGPVLLPRPRLVTPLRDRFERRLTVLTAGAGFGKSTLIAQAVSENEIEQLGSDVVVSVQEGDRAPGRLRRRIGEALGLEVDEPTTGQLVDVVWCRSPTAVALIFDDTHRLGSSEAAWSVLCELVDALPANGHVVVSGRRPPLLPIARLRATGQALVLGQDELAFSDAERGLLAAQLRLPPELADGLPHWPALATLAARVGRPASIEFLWEEVVATLAPDRLRTLAGAALFGEIDDTLVSGLDGRWRAADLVADLPLVDDLGDGAFRLHDLWSEALGPALDDEAERTALGQGARVLARDGQLLRAAAAFARAGDDSGLRQVVLDYIRRPALHLSSVEIDQLVALLPPTAVTEPLRRYFVAARCQADDDRLAASLFAQAAEQAQAAGDREVEAVARWRTVQFLTLEREPSIEAPERVRVLAREGLPYAEAMLGFLSSRQAQAGGDAEAALAALGDLDGFPPDQAEASRALRLVDLGRPEAVGVTLTQILEEDLDDINHAMAVWMSGQIPPAEAWPLARALPDRHSVRLITTRVSLEGVVAVMGVAAGDLETARRLVGESRRRSAGVARRVSLYTDVADAVLSLVTDDEETCVAKLRAALRDVPLGRWPERPYLHVLTLLRALVPEGASLDRCRLGPALTVAVEAGAALIAARQGDARPARALPWHDPTVLQVHVPPPLLAELAVAAGDQEGAAETLASIPGRAAWLRRLAEGQGPDRERARALIRSRPQRPPYDLHIGLMGRLALARSDGAPVEPWEGRARVQALLAYLALHRDALREQVAEALWPDLPAGKATANLRVNLHHLQIALEPDREKGAAPWFVRPDGPRLTLAEDGVVVDVDVVDQAMADAVRAEAAGLPSEALRSYRRVAELGTGDLLADLEVPWAAHERLRLRSVALGAVLRSGELVLACGEPESAHPLAVRAVGLDPLSERAHRLAIRCHLAVGALGSAQGAARAMAQALRDSGLAPDVESQRLLDRLGL